MNHTNGVVGSYENGSDDYWVSYVQVAYQWKTGEDNDPNAEPINPLDPEPAAGITSVWGFGDIINDDCTGVPIGGNRSLLFQEATRDLYAEIAQTLDNLVAPHEIGHQFGLDGDTGSWQIMGTTPHQPNFDLEHLHIIRCRVKSPGL